MKEKTGANAALTIQKEDFGCVSRRRVFIPAPEKINSISPIIANPNKPKTATQRTGHPKRRNGIQFLGNFSSNRRKIHARKKIQ